MLKKTLVVLSLTLSTLLFSLPIFAKPIALDELNVMPLMNGQTIPSASLKDLNGNSVDIAKLTAGKPSIIFFYRGGWCPFCNSQMGQLQAIEPQLLEMGYQLIGISPDTPEKLTASMTKQELSYTLLSDANLAASKAFGLAYFTSAKTTARYTSKMKLENKLWQTPTGESRLVLPVPAVYISDASGLVHFQYVNPNFRVRPAPELIITAAKLALK
ncbi:Alkyl hydroperoxide reductase/ Thiol specific antioxidant/ Mal allergen [Shewanella piezotolerans WP3]|uniref:thioredoxin-dependent peroxiredoxin n=1 Tax=Shewanella piezotolerans (strain WP3 / JCM 13877) TaxID=225849 RepID=B8CU06_SHEPW|nr:peroxiredoxin-like family protein [Shewanella piezotolerans]ACJ30862.1 Alkyl hydroperoxide reductase/ Thiol specific antioxidant/ Mal allergen [Shewanella piezotolerans WP3]